MLVVDRDDPVNPITIDSFSGLLGGIAEATERRVSPADGRAVYSATDET